MGALTVRMRATVGVMPALLCAVALLAGPAVAADQPNNPPPPPVFPTPPPTPAPAAGAPAALTPAQAPAALPPLAAPAAKPPVQVIIPGLAGVPTPAARPGGNQVITVPEVVNKVDERETIPLWLILLAVAGGLVGLAWAGSFGYKRYQERSVGGELVEG